MFTAAGCYMVLFKSDGHVAPSQEERVVTRKIHQNPAFVVFDLEKAFSGARYEEYTREIPITRPEEGKGAADYEFMNALYATKARVIDGVLCLTPISDNYPDKDWLWPVCDLEGNAVVEKK